jgi:hypothetical protein
MFIKLSFKIVDFLKSKEKHMIDVTPKEAVLNASIEDDSNNRSSFT